MKLPGHVIADLDEILSSAAALRALERADAAGKSYFDYEEVVLEAKGETFTIPFEVAPEELRAVLDLLSRQLNEGLKAAAPWDDGLDF